MCEGIIELDISMENLMEFGVLYEIGEALVHEHFESQSEVLRSGRGLENTFGDSELGFAVFL